MADSPVFQGHHVIEQAAYERSALLKALTRHGLYDLHGPGNMLNLPVDRALAARLGLSPHPGGPLGEYSRGLQDTLAELQKSADGQAAMRGDRAAAQRVAAKVHDLTNTMKTALVNGDLVSNTPLGMKPEQANKTIRDFFSDIDGYRRTHATQIAEIAKMPPNETLWAGVTRSEANVAATLDAIDQPGMKPMKGDALAGRQSLGIAIADANQAGRLPVSEALELRLRAGFPAEMPPILTRPPVIPETGLPAETAPRPGAGRLTRAAAGAGAVLMAYDFVTTGHRVLTLRAEGNAAGADSAGTHFVGRTAGGVLGGVGAGFLYGAIAGSETGPGALLTGLVGAGIGAYLGERWADQKDAERVFTQVDGDGNTWTRDPADPKGAWHRATTETNAFGVQREVRLVAAGGLVDELNYRAANDSYSLGLANPPQPQNPFRFDSAQDQPGWIAGPWVREESGQWRRTLVAEGMVSEFQTPEMRDEIAGAIQAAKLEEQSALVIAQNAANTPAAIAARYQVAYEQFDWKRYTGMEPVPGAIANAAASTNTLQASDGNIWTRGDDGEWRRPGMIYGDHQATGNTREELNRTWKSQQEGLRELATYAADARAHPTPTEFDLRSAVEDAYKRAGMTRSAADIDAATRAVAADHARDGLGRSSYVLAVRSGGSIETTVGHDDRGMSTRSVTTQAEIEQARNRPDTPTTPTTTPSPESSLPSSGAPVSGLPTSGMSSPEASTPITPLSARAAPTSALLDDPAHPRHALFRQAMTHADAPNPGESGHLSADDRTRLAAAITAEARANGLDTIAFAQPSPDGRRLYLADTADPTAPWARTAVVDIEQAQRQTLADSTHRVEQTDNTRLAMQRETQAARQVQEDVSGVGGRAV